MNTKPAALDAYLARTAAIHAKLARLQQLADDHFGHDPDAINWGKLATSVEWTPRSMTCWRSSTANMREATVVITLQKLTPTKSTIIRSAARHPEGRIAVLATLQGGARAKTLKGLLIRGWIVEAGDGHLLTDAGYATIGQQRPSPPPTIDDSPVREIVQPCRSGTKLAKVVAALQNPGGATIFQLMCCTGWQPHTIRGALSGMVRKKLGLNMVSTKAAGGERVYRIA